MIIYYDNSSKKYGYNMACICLCGKQFENQNILDDHIYRWKSSYYDISSDNLEAETIIADIIDIVKYELDDNKSNTCNICDKSFTMKNNLIRHISIHMNEKPYMCKFCDRACNRKADLIIHERLHTNERPYSCDLCSRSFTANSSLMHHMKKHVAAPDMTVHYCILCAKTFGSKASLGQHIRRHMKL